MRIVHAMATLSGRGAGMFHFVNSLAKEQHRAGLDVIVVALRDRRGADRHLWAPVETAQVKTAGPDVFPVANEYHDILQEISPDVVHCHGLWTYHAIAVPEYCLRRQVPYVVSPHGMLEPWAFGHNAWKKKPVWWLWERRFLGRASAVHAHSEMEVASLRGCGLEKPITVVPCGVTAPPAEAAPEADGSAPRRLLFMARVHPKKGLLNLVEAWRRVRPAQWKAVIAGPDDGGHLQEVRRAIARAGLDDDFEIVGEVAGPEKWALYRSADLFALPTFSENFGVVIAEALACGVPVITTKAAPWEMLTTERCGWWVDVGVEPLAAALREATALDDARRREMGRHGSRLVQDRFAWSSIASDLRSVYGWLLGKDDRPRSVRVAAEGALPLTQRPAQAWPERAPAPVSASGGY